MCVSSLLQRARGRETIFLLCCTQSVDFDNERYGTCVSLLALLAGKLVRFVLLLLFPFQGARI